MPKRIKQEKRPTDVNELAHQLVMLSTGQGPAGDLTQFSSTLSVYMAAIGRKGGKIGGKRRLETMSAKQRTSVAKKAAQARWKNKGKPSHLK